MWNNTSPFLWKTNINAGKSPIYSILYSFIDDFPSCKPLFRSGIFHGVGARLLELESKTLCCWKIRMHLTGRSYNVRYCALKYIKIIEKHVMIIDLVPIHHHDGWCFFLAHGFWTTEPWGAGDQALEWLQSIHFLHYCHMTGLSGGPAMKNTLDIWDGSAERSYPWHKGNILNTVGILEMNRNSNIKIFVVNF